MHFFSITFVVLLASTVSIRTTYWGDKLNSSTKTERLNKLLPNVDCVFNVFRITFF
jgi:hypothetical protein